MNKQCEIIQDLLPLYVDGVCSEASTELVQGHMDSCDICRKAYEKMTEHTNEDILQEEKKTVMVRYKRRVCEVIAWICGVAVALFCVLFSFPVLLFTFYPYSPVGIILYIISTVGVGILTLWKKNRVLKLVFGILLAIPIVVFVMVLISIGMGWLHFPG